MLEIREDDLSGEATRALLALHLAGMHATSPPGSVFALDLSGLQHPDVTVWTAWSGNSIAGVGALRALNDEAGQIIGEIKSMRTHPDHLRQGVGATLLAHIIGTAQSRGYHRLALETGSGPAFDPALTLYRTHGFTNGEAFGDYTASAFNQFLHLPLNSTTPPASPQSP